MNEKPKTLAEVTLDILIENQETQLNRLKNLRNIWNELPVQIKAELDFPKIDLHELEHDSSWYSFKKDPEGRCIFPAEEGKAAWARLKNVANESPVLTLVKAMGRNKLKKVALGLFEYRLQGDFLQRRPLQKPEDPHSKIEKTLQNVKEAGQKLS